jgi:hypothetical protein
MALGHKTGLRKAGTIKRENKGNRRPAGVSRAQPIEAVVRIATDPEASLELRGRMNSELAQYVYPKRIAVEVAGDKDAPLVVQRVVLERVSIPGLPPE